MSEQGAGQDTKEQGIPLSSVRGSSGQEAYFDDPTQEDESLINKKVHLFTSTDVSDPKEAVAEATVLSITPIDGVDYYKVFVDVSIKEETILPRPDGALQLIGDAVNESIAWPSNQVSPSIIISQPTR